MAASSGESLQRMMMKKLDETAEEYEIRTNARKTNTMVVYKSGHKQTKIEVRVWN